MENPNEKMRPQYQFLSDMYDDFFWLISSDPDAFQSAQNSIRKWKYAHEKEPKFEMKSRAEYLKKAAEREAKHRLQKKKELAEKTPTIEEILEDKKSESKEKEVKSKTTKIITNAKKENIVPKDKTEITPVKEEKFVLSEETKQAKLAEFFERVEESHLTDESKIVLKKMIDYARKYNDGIVKNYIPFNMRIYTNDDEILYSIVNIILDSFTFFNYMKNDSVYERSFFSIEDSNNITELYTKANSMVIVKDVNGIMNKEKTVRDKILNTWEDVICDYSSLDGITTIITDINKEKIDDLFMANPTLKDKIFDFELITTPSTTQEIYQEVLKTFRKDYTVTGEFEIKLLDYITETFNESTLNSTEYAQALIEKILFNQTSSVIEAESLPAYEKNKTIEEIFQDLNSLIGLDNVKQMLTDLVNLMKFKIKTEGSIKVKDTNLHMVFLGNPGTGKTTVARMVAGILYNLKYIDQNKLIEVSAKDLIGQYVGQTAPKTIAVVEKALGGVLFIDEAYSLASRPGSSGNSFNEECIATLIQAMENYRDNLVVIFAGYSKEMDVFLKSNSGIVSRIGYTLDFKDYTVPELIAILKSMFKKSGFTIQKAAVEKAKSIIEEYRLTEGFGNARFVRNLYEKAIIKHASNTHDKTSKKDLRTITADDITSDNLIKL